MDREVRVRFGHMQQEQGKLPTLARLDVDKLTGLSPEFHMILVFPS